MVSTKDQRLAAEPQWSDYQLTVFDWLKNGTGHCQIEAAAGSGKSTCILGVVNRIPCSRQPTAVLAFNRHVARELKQKLGDRSGLTVSTCHSMGLSVLRRYFGGQPIEVNENKYHNLCKKAMKSLLDLRVQYEQDWRNSPESAKEKYPQRLPLIGQGTKESKQLEHEMLSLLKHTVRYSQMTLTEPTPDALKGMIKHFSLETPKEPEAIDWVLHLVPLVLAEGERVAADYLDVGVDDLIWLPNAWNVNVPQKRVVLWDEAQDANRAMLGLVLKAVKDGGRLIVVGDRRQAIMGFAGSDANSWEHIHSELHPTVLPLSICYRCPVSHIELAKHIVPLIESRPGAPQGTIQVISLKDVKELVQPGDLIVCRFTAPLVSLCLQLIIAGEKATVKGHEIGKDIADLVRRAMIDSKYPTDFHSALNGYCFPKVAFFKEQGEERKAESLLDKLEAIRTCFNVFGLECSTLEQFCTRIQELFSEDGSRVVLSTIHKGKGDEADRVFILGSNFLPFLTKTDQAWQVQQEWNLVYVGITRAKQDLYFVPLNKKDTPATEYLDDPLGGLRLPKEGELDLNVQVCETEFSISVDETPDINLIPQTLVPSPAEHLTDLIRQAQTWVEVEAEIAAHPEHKAEAWQLLDASAKARIKALKDQVAISQPAAPEQSAVETPSPQSVALKVLECETWEQFEWLLDAVGAKLDKIRVNVYRHVLKHLSLDDRQHLVKLLREHIQQFPRDHWCYTWLPASSEKLIAKARAAARNEVAEVAEVAEESLNENEDDYFGDPEYEPT